MDTNKPVIGILGAGRLGTAIAKQALAAGYTVHIANSKEPESLALILSVLLPGAIAGTAASVVDQSDIIVLALPLNKYRTLVPDAFAGKIVIDAMNYWAPTEGYVEAFAGELGSSEQIQKYLPSATVVKALNHIAYNEVVAHALPASSGDAERRVALLAGDDNAANHQVAKLLDAMGFSPYVLGTLESGRAFQPDSALFNSRFTLLELPNLLR